jgi:hypothetical protein
MPLGGALFAAVVAKQHFPEISHHIMKRWCCKPM